MAGKLTAADRPSMLEVDSDPPAAIVELKASGSTVTVGPSLIHKGQILTVALLVDGESPSLSCDKNLIDVNVREQTDEFPGRVAPPWLWVLDAAIPALLLAFAAWQFGEPLRAFLLGGIAAGVVVYNGQKLIVIRQFRRAWW